MNLVSLEKLNKLRFPDDPVPVVKLQRWCRDGVLPARRLGGEWRVDLDAFDKGNNGNTATGTTAQAEAVLRKLQGVTL